MILFTFTVLICCVMYSIINTYKVCKNNHLTIIVIIIIHHHTNTTHTIMMSLHEDVPFFTTTIILLLGLNTGCSTQKYKDKSRFFIISLFLILMGTYKYLEVLYNMFYLKIPYYHPPTQIHFATLTNTHALEQISLYSYIKGYVDFFHSFQFFIHKYFIKYFIQSNIHTSKNTQLSPTHIDLFAPCTNIKPFYTSFPPHLITTCISNLIQIHPILTTQDPSKPRLSYSSRELREL